MKVFQDIAGLIKKGKETNLIEATDEIYVRNQILHLLKLESYPEKVDDLSNDTIPNLLESIITYAINHHVIEDVFDDKEILSANIMNCLVPRPSVVNQTFNHLYNQSPNTATDYFYSLSKHSNYIQMNRIAKNIHFKSQTTYGELDITINLSKPEKDPEQIKREREKKPKDIAYPICVLCAENEGYTGRTGYPARANHRIINVPIQDENWYLQYSPYVYYNEHSILLSEEHRPMKIDKRAFLRLLTFTEKFPHYFIGSNADLPIVGGSILSHDHYQAGRYAFAMTKAESIHTFHFHRFPNVTGSILKWPLSVIRLTGKTKEEVVAAGDHVLQSWKVYNDDDAQIVAFSEETPHNTITPIARKRDGHFELDLVLRNNRTTTEHPLGIFHPHEDVHHIKKENIGLIEVMGLAVLPARLQTELETIKEFLRGKDVNVEDYHLEWAQSMREIYGSLKSDQEAQHILEKELAKKFARVLEDAGVFKQNKEGIEAFKRFIHVLTN